MADDPNTAVLEAPEADVPEAEAPEAESPPEERTFTLAELRAMPIDEVRKLYPQLDEWADTTAEERYQDELERAKASLVEEAKETGKREEEDRYLEWVGTAKPEIYYAELKRIAGLRETRRARALELKAGGDQGFRARLEHAEALATQLQAVSPTDVEDLRKRRWAAGDPGLRAYTAAVTDLLITRKAEAMAKQTVAEQEKLIKATERKSALAETVGESPDVSGATSTRRGAEDYDWFSRQSLTERNRIRREEPARYDAIVATIGRK